MCQTVSTDAFRSVVAGFAGRRDTSTDSIILVSVARQPPAPPAMTRSAPPPSLALARALTLSALPARNAHV
jgi:hypothetical protein